MTAEIKPSGRDSKAIADAYEQQFGWKVPGSRLAPHPTTPTYDKQQLEEIIASKQELTPKPALTGGIFFMDRGVVTETRRSIDDQPPTDIRDIEHKGRQRENRATDKNPSIETHSRHKSTRRQKANHRSYINRQLPSRRR